MLAKKVDQLRQLGLSPKYIQAFEEGYKEILIDCLEEYTSQLRLAEYSQEYISGFVAGYNYFQEEANNESE